MYPKNNDMWRAQVKRPILQRTHTQVHLSCDPFLSTGNDYSPKSLGLSYIASY